MQRPKLTSRGFAEPDSSFCLWGSQAWRGGEKEAGGKAPQERRAEGEQREEEQVQERHAACQRWREKSGSQK